MSEAKPDLPIARAIELIRNGDLTTLTFKSIMNTLKSEFGPDIGSRKSELRQLVNDTIDQMNKSNNSGEDIEPNADSASVEAPRSSVRSKRKATSLPRRSSGKKPRSESGLRKAIGISPDLAEFLGVTANESGARMARTEVTKAMIRYIKENSLQSPTDGRRIICDEPLRKLLGVNETTFFSLQKVLAPHFERSSTKSSDEKGSSSKSRRSDSGKSAFHKPYLMSNTLQAMLGVSEPMSRPQIVKAIWAYIKENQLQNPDDRRFILCDNAMKAVFKCSNLHMMKMNKILSDHITSAESDTLISAETDHSASQEDDGSADEAVITVESRPDIKLEQF